jgi:hypothetical protein
MSPKMNEASKAGREVGPGVRYVAPGDVDPEIAHTGDRVRERALRQLRADGIERGRELNRAVPVQYAIAAGGLPHSSVAVIVRDPVARFPRLVIFSAPTVDDAAFVIADFALRRDETQRPVHTGRRILFVTSDQRVRTDDGTDEGALSIEHTFAGQQILVKPFLQAMQRGVTVQVDGLGPVKVLVSAEQP